MHPYLARLPHPFGGPPLVVTTYGALMFAGAALGIVLTILLARRDRRLEPFDVFAAGLLGFVGGLVGARLAFALLHGPQIVRTQGWAALAAGGGYVWYGGFLGGVLALLLYVRAYRLPLRALLDLGAPGLALAHALGRVGCFTAGCCHGAPAPGHPFAVVFPAGSFAPPGVPLHPVQLYEALGLLVISALLLALLRLARWRPGAVAFSYVVLYALLRIGTEALRADDRGGQLGPFSPSQLVAGLLLLTAMAVALLARITRPHPPYAKGTHD